MPHNPIRGVLAYRHLSNCRSNCNNRRTPTMPPKKKKEEAEDLGAMKAARFGRVKNDLAMGFVGEFGLF